MGTPPANSSEVIDVVALGSSCVDQIFSLDDIMRLELTDRNGADRKYLAIEVSTKLNVRNVSFFPGGSAANIAVDLGIIGLKTAFFGGIGIDPPGQACKEDFLKYGVNLEGLHEFDTPTGLSVILLTPWGRDRSIMAFKGSSDMYSKIYCKDDALRRARCFVWTSLTSDSAFGAIEHCIDVCTEAGVLIAAAPSISILQKRKKDCKRLMKKCKLTSMNEEELEVLTGEKDPRAGIKVLLGWGLEIVQITLGKQGAYLAYKQYNKLIKTKPPPVTVTDTTGAGDASISGLIYGVLAGKEPEVCAKYAGAMSAMEIESPGVRKGLPTNKEELEKFIASRTIPQETFTLI